MRFPLRMQEQSKRPQRSLEILWLLRLALCTFVITNPFSRASNAADDAAITQRNAQEIAAIVNNKGSDDSMEEATTNAMRALNNLAALNIPGAITNGYRAYGNYINSEKMDELEARAKRRRDSLGSGKAAPFMGKNTSTTFSRLDPGFLYRGEANEVAEEFEKRSGMKREEFLQHLGSATDSDISYDDPALLQKLEQRFQLFTSRIPNKEYREGLEQAANLFPGAMRNKVLGELADFYFGNKKGSGMAKSAAPSAPVTSLSDPTAPAAPALTPTPIAMEEIPSENRAPASVAGVAPSEAKNMGLLGLAGNTSESFRDFFQAAGLVAENESLFQVISKKYRKLTPSLSGRTSVLNSK